MKTNSHQKAKSDMQRVHCHPWYNQNLEKEKAQKWSPMMCTTLEKQCPLIMSINNSANCKIPNCEKILTYVNNNNNKRFRVVRRRNILNLHFTNSFSFTLDFTHISKLWRLWRTMKNESWLRMFMDPS